MDWTESLDRYILDKDELRASVPLDVVVTKELGVDLDDEVGLCPFHEDTRPSFAVFESEDGVMRAGCWACGWRGDVYDVIRSARSCSFQEALSVAREYVDADAYAGADRVKQVVVRDFDSEYQEAMTRSTQPVVEFVRGKGYPWDAAWLREQWYVGTASTVGIGSVFIPHFVDGHCTGYKWRTAHTPPMSAHGSRFTALYGSWKDRGDAPMVLVEGESDTWAVSWWLPELTALGLPTGADGLRPDWIKQLSTRDVTICFDGDEAGRRATERWVTALPDARVVELAEGVDCVKLGRSLRDAILVG